VRAGRTNSDGDEEKQTGVAEVGKRESATPKEEIRTGDTGSMRD